MEVWGGNEAIDNGVSMPGLDAWVYSRPYKGDVGGGDVHYVSSCATGRVTRILVADVSGHGQIVAEVARSLRALLRRYVNFVDQTKVVESMNREFTQLAEMGTFATAVVATYWAPTDYLVTCNAGHPRPLLYRAGTRTWQLLKAPPVQRASVAGTDGGLINLPLGIAEPTGYEQFGLRLRPGDLVLVHTDSLIEARDPSGAMLTERGLLSLVQEIDVSRPARIIPDLLARIAARGARAEAEDDVTVLLLRHNGSQPRWPFLRGLLAPFRIVRAVWTRVRHGADAPAPFPEFSIANIFGALVPAVSRLWRPRSPRGKS
jgi:serine phosphatase RsbU (regulator of sigma subunit)